MLQRLSLAAGAVAVQCCAVAEGPKSYCCRAVASWHGQAQCSLNSQRNSKCSLMKNHPYSCQSLLWCWLWRRQGPKSESELSVSFVLWFFPRFWTSLVCREHWHWFQLDCGSCGSCRLGCVTSPDCSCVQLLLKLEHSYRELIKADSRNPHALLKVMRLGFVGLEK